jgi:hypothetical protein
MNMTFKRAYLLGLVSAAGLLGTILTAAGGDIWMAKVDHEKRITTMEVKDEAIHEVLIDVHQDVKDIRQDIKEIIRRLDSKQ